MKKFLIAALLIVAGQGVLAEGFAGEWTLTIDTPRGIQHPTLIVNQEGEQYSGVYNSLRGPIPVEMIKVEGNSFSFPLKITVPIGEIEVLYNGTFEGDEMMGSAKNPRGEVPFTGKRG